MLAEVDRARFSRYGTTHVEQSGHANDTSFVTPLQVREESLAILHWFGGSGSVIVLEGAVVTGQALALGTPDSIVGFRKLAYAGDGGAFEVVDSGFVDLVAQFAGEGEEGGGLIHDFCELVVGDAGFGVFENSDRLCSRLE